MPTTVTIGTGANPSVVGKSVSQQDESNYLACRSGSGDGGGTEGGTGQQMNIGIRTEKTKTSGTTIAHSYTIMRHIIRFQVDQVLPAGAQITDATLTLTSGGVTQDLTFADGDSFTYATSSVSVVAATGTGNVVAGDYDSFNITDGTGDLTDRGMTFRTYDDIVSGSAVPETNGQTVTIQLNQNAFDDLQAKHPDGVFDVGIINTKFDKGTFLSGSQPGSNIINDNPPDGNGQFTSPGNSHDTIGTDVHHEGTFIKFFGSLGYGGQGVPLLTYTFKEPESAGKIIISNKIVHSSGKISQIEPLV